MSNRTMLGRLAVAQDQVLFFDDNLANVEAARDAGLAAELFHIERGVEALARLLRQHGIGTG
jgi:putative hydrolase of the HAD superfamily